MLFQRKFNIADYFNPQCIFEDPWENLIKEHEAKIGKLSASIESDSNTSQDSPNISTNLNTTNENSLSQELVDSSNSSDTKADWKYELCINDSLDRYSSYLEK